MRSCFCVFCAALVHQVAGHRQILMFLVACWQSGAMEELCSAAVLLSVCSAAGGGACCD